MVQKVFALGLHFTFTKGLFQQDIHDDMVCQHWSVRTPAPSPKCNPTWYLLLLPSFPYLTSCPDFTNVLNA